MRTVVLDTETTGLETSQGHRIIEIGCVELDGRKLTGRHFHKYVNPQRQVDEGAFEVHGISDDFLRDKPLFGDVVDELVEFIRGADLVIHNAAFDVGFLDNELKLLASPPITNILQVSTVTDSLLLARHKHPGQKNSLDALCKRYEVDNSQRELHGALLDAEILADVYLAITGGQTKLLLGADEESGADNAATKIRPVSVQPGSLRVLPATAEEMQEHEQRLDAIDKKSDGSIWRQL